MSAYSFTDSNGVKYDISVTFRTIFQVAERTGYDILNPHSQENGLTLEERLVTQPTVVVKIVAALCGVDDLDAFYEAIDGKAYKGLEKAFWDAYLNFFVQSGRGYAATALQIDLKAKSEAERLTEEKLKKSLKKNFSNSSPSPDSETGKIERSGNSNDSPKPTSDSKPKTALKSSAQSTTPTAQERKTSGARPTSTTSREPAPKKKPKNS